MKTTSMRRGSQSVRQRSAKSLRPVRLRSTPPFFCLFDGLWQKLLSSLILKITAAWQIFKLKYSLFLKLQRVFHLLFIFYRAFLAQTGIWWTKWTKWTKWTRKSKVVHVVHAVHQVHLKLFLRIQKKYQSGLFQFRLSVFYDFLLNSVTNRRWTFFLQISYPENQFFWKPVVRLTVKKKNE